MSTFIRERDQVQLRINVQFWHADVRIGSQVHDLIKSHMGKRLPLEDLGRDAVFDQVREEMRR